jgi:hypothetical protein
LSGTADTHWPEAILIKVVKKNKNKKKKKTKTKKEKKKTTKKKKKEGNDSTDECHTHASISTARQWLRHCIVASQKASSVCLSYC